MWTCSLLRTRGVFLALYPHEQSAPCLLSGICAHIHVYVIFYLHRKSPELQVVSEITFLLSKAIFAQLQPTGITQIMNHNPSFTPK